MGTLTERLAEAHGDAIAFFLRSGSVLARDRDTLTFIETHQVVERLAISLRNAGIGRDDLVAILSPNGCDYLLSILAVARAGAVSVPVNPLLKPAEVRSLVERSSARIVLCSAETLRRAARGRTQFHSVKRWLSLGPAPGAIDLLAPPGSARAHRRRPSTRTRSVVAVLYTSGTTGRPKPVRLTSEGILSVLRLTALHPSGAPVAFRLAITALPIAHIMGLASAVGLMCAGVAQKMLPRFDARTVLDAIELDRADVFIGVPTMYRDMLDAGAAKRDLSSIRLWISAADVMPRELASTFQSFGRFAGPLSAMFVEGYGMVESSGIAMVRVFAPLVRGRPTPWVLVPPWRARVVDTRGHALPTGRTGELCLGGPGIMAGYQRSREKDAAILPGGWLRTGDLARMSRLGTVTLAGRKKDVIKVGGYSVSPVEIEEEIRTHPAVADVAAVALADRRLGQVPAVVVVPKKGAHPTPDSLGSWAARTMASHRRPRRWVVVRQLPRNASGKIDRKALSRLLTNPT